MGGAADVGAAALVLLAAPAKKELDLPLNVCLGRDCTASAADLPRPTARGATLLLQLCG